MLKRMLFVLILGLSAIVAQAASIVTGTVGNDEMVTTDLEPRAIVMPDQNGNDAMVVFYRLREKKKDHLIGFSIARSVTSNGKLVWDSKDYILKPEVLSTRGFAPQPQMLDGVLYLFGGEQVKKDSRGIFYNSFDSLEDLINHAQGGAGNSRAQDTKTRVGHLEYVSSVVRGSEIFLSYYASYNGGPSRHSICLPSQGSLTCKNSQNGYGNSDGMLNMVNLDYNGIQETVMFRPSSPNRYLSFSLYDEAANKFNTLYTLNGKNGNIDIDISPKPSAGLQIDNTLRIYFIEQGSANIQKTALLLDDLYVTKGAFWAEPLQFKHPYKQGHYFLRAKSGLSAVEFKDRIYVFFQETDRVARYFVDVK